MAINFLPPALTIVNFEQQEKRAFEFFLHRAAPVLSGTLDSEFWRLLVPQLSQNEPVIRNAVLAISCLYEYPQNSPYPIEPDTVPREVNPHHRQALKWYNKAIAQLNHCLQEQQDSSLALLSCLLFVCIEIQQDNISNALTLLEKGFKMLSSINRTSMVGASVAPFFERYAVLASTFGTSDWFRRPNDQPVDLSFSLVQEARSALYKLMERGHAFIRLAGMRIVEQGGTEDLRPLQQDLSDQLFEWHIRFMGLRCTPSVASQLLMYYEVSVIWLSTRFDSQTEFDKYNTWFENVVHHAATILAEPQPPITFEMGVIPPLYFVATKCRDPLIRRKALSLLRKAPNRESLWSGPDSVRVVEKVIALEEETNGRFVEFPPGRPVTHAVDPQKRTRHLEVVQDSEVNGIPQIAIKAERYFDNLHGERELREEVLRLREA